MTKGTISFSEARELGIPEDLIAFAQESPGSRGRMPFAADSVRRDALVRQYMEKHNEPDYGKAFGILFLGKDPAETSNFSAAPQRQQKTVAAKLEEMLGSTRASK
jgi:hypothetical protein